MKGGGITINPIYYSAGYTPEILFDLFINNSTITFFSSGRYGIILKATLKPDTIMSPYMSFDNKNFTQLVNNIVVKISLLTLLGNDITCLYKYRDNPKTRESQKVTEISEFQKEIDTQRDIVEKTFTNLRPITPSIVYASSNFNFRSSLCKLNNFKIYIENSPDRTFHSYKRLPEFLQFGVIAMESMENMSPLFRVFKIDHHFNPIQDIDIFTSQPVIQLYIAGYI